MQGTTIQFERQQYPGGGMHDQVEYVDRSGKFAGCKHPELLQQVRLRDEGRQPQGERGDHEKYQWLSINPVQIGFLKNRG